jgi:aryl-alcohol dehydrogenase-like predicted oxidoreductase
MRQKDEPLVALGRTDVRVSAVGVGTNTWGRRGDPSKRPVFDALLGAGITLFDTAEIYTMGGSERAIGDCMAGGAGTRPAPVVLSKFFPMPWRVRKAALPAALGRSLGRLGLPRVDVYLLHFPVPPVALETWADALADEVHAGRARAVGISNCTAEQTLRAHAALAARGVPLACNEVEYSLLQRASERSGLLETCRELGVTMIAYRPLRLGLLSGKYSAGNRPGGWRGLMFGRSSLEKLAPLLALLKRIGEHHGGKTPSQVAINWVLCKGALPIPGAKNEKQAVENAAAMGWRLTDEEVAELDETTPPERGARRTLAPTRTVPRTRAPKRDAPRTRARQAR